MQSFFNSQCNDVSTSNQSEMFVTYISTLTSNLCILSHLNIFEKRKKRHEVSSGKYRESLPDTYIVISFNIAILTSESYHHPNEQDVYFRSIQSSFYHHSIELHLQFSYGYCLVLHNCDGMCASDCVCLNRLVQIYQKFIL